MRSMRLTVWGSFAKAARHRIFLWETLSRFDLKKRQSSSMIAWRHAASLGWFSLAVVSRLTYPSACVGRRSWVVKLATAHQRLGEKT